MEILKRPNVTRMAMVFCIGILMVSFLDIQAAQWGGYVDDSGGILSVMNPEMPMLPAQTIKAEELWRVGGDDDEDNELIGFVTDVVVDEEGLSYLLDSTLSVIRVYGPDGTSLREIGGEGQGPGEFTMANEFTFLPNRNLGVIQMMPGRVVTLDRNGDPGPAFSLEGETGGMSLILNAGSSAHGIVLGKVSTNFNNASMTSTHSLAVYDSEGHLLHSILEETEEQTGGSISLGGDDHPFTRRWSVGPDGRVYVAQYDQEYKIEVFDAQGAAERVIFREYSSLKRSSEEIAEDEERNAELAARFGGQSEDMEVPKFARDINTMYPRPNGHLWVSTSRGSRNSPAGVVGVFDEYDTEGKFVRQVSIEADYVSGRFRSSFRMKRRSPCKTKLSRPES